MFRSRRSSQRREMPSIALITVLTLTFITFAPRSYAQDGESILHNFGTTSSDGDQLVAGVIIDAAGNLYGTAQQGGVDQNGIVYELSPSAGGWLETILYSFTGKSDGGWPSSGLILDAAGNLYGTGYYGGAQSPDCSPSGCGVVYELSPSVGGGWIQTVIHTFHGGVGGYGPFAGLTMDAAGNLYGTAAYGGLGYGVVYELSPSSAGWQYKPLHAFTNGPDGNEPNAGVTLDATGNLYTATLYGGQPSAGCPDGCGAIIKLTPTTGGTWTGSLVHDFKDADGAIPGGGVAVDAAGNVYASTQFGGSSGLGTVIELSPSGSGWRKTRIYDFNSSNGAGYNPDCNLVLDSSGNVFGTTPLGEKPGTGGSVFELSPASGGTFTMKVLHAFSSNNDGMKSYSGIVFDSAGNIYGTTADGGLYNKGTVYELTP
jgi:uncharacterized repeat protein (TIGR03803 family)